MVELRSVDILAIFFIVLFLILAAYEIGSCCALYERYRLRQENQRLKQMLDDMKHMEEFGFKTYCAMIREASCQPQTQPGKQKIDRCQ